MSTTKRNSILKKKNSSSNNTLTSANSLGKSRPKCKYFSNEISPNWKKLQIKLSYKKTITSKPTSNMNNKFKKNKSKVDTGKNDDNEIWFDGVDSCLIASSKINSSNLCKQNSFNGLTRCVAMDCEMVGTGFSGNNSVLARVSIVNLYGHCVYDKFVKPIEKVTDYRTEVSGIRPKDLKNGHDFKVVQSEVFEIIKNRILVGHSISYDLNVLYLSHPKHRIRDTSVYFKRFFNNRTPSLKKLSQVYLGIEIQHGEHDSIVDAQATMRLYTLFKEKWESSITKHKSHINCKQRTTVIQKLH